MFKRLFKPVVEKEKSSVTRMITRNKQEINGLVARLEAKHHTSISPEALEAIMLRRSLEVYEDWEILEIINYFEKSQGKE